MPIPIDWKVVASKAEAFLEDPRSLELAQTALDAIVSSSVCACNNDVLSLVVKVGYTLVAYYWRDFPSFGWPHSLTAVLLAYLDDEDVQRQLDQGAADLGCEAFQLAPVFGNAIDMPELITNLDYRLWSKAIMSPQAADVWRELARLGSGVVMIHPLSGPAQHAFRVAAMFNSGS